MIDDNGCYINLIKLKTRYIRSKRKLTVKSHGIEIGVAFCECCSYGRIGKTIKSCSDWN